MFCQNCGENLPNEANLCPKCRAPVLGPKVPTPDAPSVPPRRNTCPITGSGMVYLFADQFVRKPRFGGETVPCTDTKVYHHQLAEMAMAAAFIWLEENGHVTLNIAKKKAEKGILRKRTVLYDRVFVVRRGQIPYLGAALRLPLESRIWNLLMYEDNAFDLTYWLVGEDFSSPSRIIIGFVRDYLIEEGYFLKKEKKELLGLRTVTEFAPDCAKVAGLREYVEGTRSTILEFTERRPRVYPQILKDIRDAITSRHVSDNGFDFD